MAYYEDLAEMYVGSDVSPDFYGWVFPLGESEGRAPPPWHILLSGSRRTGGGLLLDDEPSDLHLALAVEGDHAHGDVRVGLEALLDLGDDLGPVGAAEEGQLPHVPVAVVVVAGAEDGVDLGDGLVAVLELDAGGPPVADHVVDLLGDLRVGEVGQEGHALVRHGALGVPGHDGLGGPDGGGGGARGAGHGGAGDGGAGGSHFFLLGSGWCRRLGS